MYDVNLSLLFLGSGLAIDVLSCFLNSKKLIMHTGRSGIPAVSMVIYLLVFLWDENLIILMKFVDIVLFFGIHILLQYLFPVLLRKLAVKPS